MWVTYVKVTAWAEKVWESEERVIYWRGIEADIVGERMRSADRLSGKSSERWPFPTTASKIKPIAFKPKTTNIMVRHENYVYILSTAFSGVVWIHRQKKHYLCFKSGDLIKPQVFLIFGAGGRSRLWCCPSLDWSLEAPACVHVCMSYTALCQVEFIRVQLNLFFLSL